MTKDLHAEVMWMQYLRWVLEPAGIAPEDIPRAKEEFMAPEPEATSDR